MSAMVSWLRRYRTSWVLALRLSRREIWRNKVRSVWVCLTIGLPVAVLTGAVWFALTVPVTTTAGLEQIMGASQARLSLTSYPHYRQYPDGSQNYASGEPVELGRADLAGQSPRSTSTPLEQLSQLIRDRLDPQARLIPGRVFSVSAATNPAAYGSLRMLTLDARDPATAGMMSLRSGRWPSAAHEVLVSTSAVSQRHLPDHGPFLLRTNSRTDSAPTPVTVVGTVEVADFKPVELMGFAAGLTGGEYAVDVVGLPTSTLAPSSMVRETDYGSTDQIFFLVDSPTPLTWQQVQPLNQLGWAVQSRAVFNDPPHLPSRQMSQLRGGWAYFSLAFDGWDPTLIGVALVALFILALEIGLLTAPAFAIGSRTHRRWLAQAATQGSDRRQITRLMTGQALLLGAISAGLGVGLGALGGSVLAHVRAGSQAVVRLLYPQVVLISSLVIAVMALLCAGVTAWLLARPVSRLSPVHMLRPPPPSRRRRRAATALAGALLVASCVSLVLFSETVMGQLSTGDPSPALLLVWLALTAAALVFAFIRLTPALLGLACRLVRRRGSLSARMGMRDASRNSSRTVPAIAGITAATMLLVAALTGATTMAHYYDNAGSPLPAQWAVVQLDANDHVLTTRRIAAALPSAHLETVWQAYFPATLTDEGSPSSPLPWDSWISAQVMSITPSRCLSPATGLGEVVNRQHSQPGCSTTDPATLSVSVVAMGPDVAGRSFGLDARAQAGLRSGQAVVLLPYLGRSDREPETLDSQRQQQVNQTWNATPPVGPVALLRGANATTDSTPAWQVVSASTTATPVPLGDQQDQVQEVLLPSGSRVVQTTNSTDEFAGHATLLISPEQAQRWGMRLLPSTLIVQLPQAFQATTTQQLRDAVGPQAVILAPTFILHALRTLLWGLVVVTALLVVVSTLTVTAMSSQQSQHDAATLGACGANPRMAAQVAAWRAWLCATWGTIMGSAVGIALTGALLPMLLVLFMVGIWTTNSVLTHAVQIPRYNLWDSQPEDFQWMGLQILRNLSLPWWQLGVILVVTPLVAAGCSALFGRLRLTSERHGE